MQIRQVRSVPGRPFGGLELAAENGSVNGIVMLSLSPLVLLASRKGLQRGIYVLISCSLKAIKGQPHEAWHKAIERRFGGSRPGPLRFPGLARQSPRRPRHSLILSSQALPDHGPCASGLHQSYFGRFQVATPTQPGASPSSSGTFLPSKAAPAVFPPPSAGSIPSGEELSTSVAVP